MENAERKIIKEIIGKFDIHDLNGLTILEAIEYLKGKRYDFIKNTEIEPKIDIYIYDGDESEFFIERTETDDEYNKRIDSSSFFMVYFILNVTILVGNLNLLSCYFF